MSQVSSPVSAGLASHLAECYALPAVQAGVAVNHPHASTSQNDLSSAAPVGEMPVLHAEQGVIGGPLGSVLYLDASPDALTGLLVSPPTHTVSPNENPQAPEVPYVQWVRFSSPCIPENGLPDWHQALTAAGMALPKQVIACGQPTTTLYDADWITGWRSVLGSAHSAARVHAVSSLPMSSLPMSRVAPLTAWCEALGAHAVVAPQEAAVRGVLRVPDVARRVARQGGVVIHCGRLRTSIFLVFRDQVLGVWEDLPAPARSLDAWLADLREFCLLWLPDEVVRQHGGTGCVFAPAIPEEAESFAPVWVTGPEARIFAGHGRLLTGSDADGLRCRGMAYPVWEADSALFDVQ